MVIASDLDVKDSLTEVFLNHLMEIHIVDKSDIFYKKGRQLASDAYRQVWNTENLIDGNDYGVIISHQGKVIGNINIQIRQGNKPLKSEAFFGKEHWQAYFKESTYRFAEISALATNPDISTDLRQPTMMMLILGITTICLLEKIDCFVTVQHKFLIRLLTKSLRLPFFRNEIVTTPQGELPNDDYWKHKDSPGIYYLDTHSTQLMDSCFSFLCYLNLAGINTAFLPNLQKANLSYSSLLKELAVRKKGCGLFETCDFFDTSLSL